MPPAAASDLAHVWRRPPVGCKKIQGVTPVFGTAACTKLIEKLLAFEAVNDIQELRPLLQRT